MKIVSSLVLVLALGLTPALAQTAAAPATTAPAAAAPATTAAPVASDLTKDGKPRMKVVRAQCKDEVQGQGLKGAARKDAMAACIVKQRPDKAAAMKCRMDPQTKGMDKTARKAFVKDCVAKTKA
ncbi:hypothetical protein LGH83_17635 [Lichenihabitans sp. PAMC28606]|uniref:hypothetical protein n=1 Tax=Lichenihabitans sp. PAMC28606 TaxID=2880932 RepID=UPI001D0AE8BB|nr:hypothetical protein [Lichenihabitans sp. PAMC28606]UDL94315.1 hypothetical protein LGH83_17635 [Lichenihabitans sp. PAMC28606]